MPGGGTGILKKALYSYRGRSDALGTNSRIMCSALAALPDYNNQAVLILNGPCRGQCKDISGITTGGQINISGTFSAVITAGVAFLILTHKPATAEVAGIKVNTDLIPAVKAKTDNLPIFPANETTVSAVKAKTDNLPASPANETTVSAIKTQTDKIAGKMIFRMIKWSEGKVQVQIDAAGATTILPTITIANLPATATIVEAHLMFKFRMIENKHAGVNNLNGATVALTSQVFQIQDDGGGAWADGINLVDNFFTLASEAREGGDVIVGTPNVGVANVVDGNDTYNVRLFLGKADQDFINFDDCQVGLDILYSV